MKKILKGFTLAEVLITLTIIGVVAAITIPTLINNYQKKQYVTSLKKAYSSINQALVEISSDYSCVGNLGCTGLFKAGSNSKTFGDVLASKFKLAKNCDLTADAGCFPAITQNYYDGSNNSTATIDNYNGYYRFVTTDGVSIALFSHAIYGGTSVDCEDTSLFATPGHNMSKVCGFMYIDVNGPKPPNAKGRDTFYFWITNGNGPLIYPHGGKDYGWWQAGNPDFCSTENKIGSACAGRVMEEGWEMNY